MFKTIQIALKLIRQIVRQIVFRRLNKMIVDGKKISELFEGDFELVDDGLSDGNRNMEIDYQRMLMVEEKRSLPTLRFYGWKPWAVSLGANQKVEDFNTSKLQEFGIDIVRRPTGGRAVLHANELTYSIVMNVNGNLAPQDIYREIHLFIVYGLSRLGVKDLTFGKSQPNFREYYKKEISSVSCFASSARYEIEWQGKKIVGSAQRLVGKTLLQHGSILLGRGYELLPELTNLSSEEMKKNLREHITNHSISVGEILGKEISFNQAKQVFIDILAE